jgi:hypothetical protein
MRIGSRASTSAKNSSGGFGLKPPGALPRAGPIQSSQVMKSFFRRNWVHVLSASSKRPLVLLHVVAGCCGGRARFFSSSAASVAAGAAELALVERHQLAWVKGMSATFARYQS